MRQFEISVLLTANDDTLPHTVTFKMKITRHFKVSTYTISNNTIPTQTNNAKKVNSLNDFHFFIIFYKSLK
jgi:hypothetical protein